MRPHRISHIAYALGCGKRNALPDRARQRYTREVEWRVTRGCISLLGAVVLFASCSRSPSGPGGSGGAAEVRDAARLGDSGGSGSSSGGGNGGGSGGGSGGRLGVGGSGLSGSTGGATGAGGAPISNPDASVSGRDYSTDRSRFFGNSRCGSAGVLLCDDFESGTIDSSIWEAHSSGTMPTIDGTRAARGSRALHVRGANNGFAYILERKTFPVPNDTYYGRMFVWLSLLPTAPDWAHWNLVEAAGTGTPAVVRVGGQWNPFTQKSLFGQGSDNGPTGDWTNLDGDPAAAPVPVPVQSWVCLEWMHNGAANETRFYWDATEHPSLHATGTMHGGDQGQVYDLPSFTSVWVGWWFYQGNTLNQTFDVWIDEVAIDKERIGCVL